MTISAAARQRVVTGLWGGRKNGSFAGRAATALAAITGTATASITEADIVAGGKTIIITLANDTWAAAGAAFNAQRQAIINGIDSAQAEATGWDAVVKAGLAVGTVVRTSATVVTVTLSAFATYNITASETITVTVPASALVTSLVAVVGVPTFSVSALADTTTRSGGGGIEKADERRRGPVAVKPSGVQPKTQRGARKTEARQSRIEQTRDDAAEIAARLAREFTDSADAESVRQSELESERSAAASILLTRAEVEDAITALAGKKKRTESEEILLLLLLAASA